MTYHRRYYRRRSGTSPVAVGAGVVVVAVMLAGSHGHHHGTADSADSMAGPVAVHVPRGPYAPATWAVAFLHADGKRATSCNKAFVIAWQNTEATWSKFRNPLDSTEPMPGSYAVNSAGVQHYKSMRQGLEATVITIRNGLYPAIESALTAGNNASAAATAVEHSPWGTGLISVSC